MNAASAANPNLWRALCLLRLGGRSVQIEHLPLLLRRHRQVRTRGVKKRKKKATRLARHARAIAGQRTLGRMAKLLSCMFRLAIWPVAAPSPSAYSICMARRVTKRVCTFSDARKAVRPVRGRGDEKEKKALPTCRELSDNGLHRGTQEGERKDGKKERGPVWFLGMTVGLFVPAACLCLTSLPATDPLGPAV